MKKLFFIAFAVLKTVDCTSSSLLFIDTAGNNKHVYRTFLTLAETAGFTSQYLPAYSVQKHQIEQHQAIIISLDGGFFSTIARELQEKNIVTSAYAKHILEIIAILGTRNNKLIGIIIPNASSILLLTLTLQLLKYLHITSKESWAVLEPTLLDQIQHLLLSDASKSYRYNTALLPMRESLTSTGKMLPQTTKNDVTVKYPHEFHTLPVHAVLPSSHELFPLLPLGLYVKNSQTNNQFFISTMHVISGTDSAEAFMLNPVDTPLRVQLVEMLATMVHELAYAQHHRTLPPCPLVAAVPMSLKPEYMLQQKALLEHHKQQYKRPIYTWAVQEGVWCGWMGIEQYQTQEAVEHLLDSGLNVLWFELNPEWYLSDTAILSKDKATFFKKISTFTALLKKVCTQRNQKPPHIFVGTDITSNFTQKKVKNVATDMYCKEYDKIPSPLDRDELWKPELLTVIDRFIDEWDTSLSNGIALSGVFLDLEMYHAQQQSGQFLSLMDFSDYAWKLYSNTVAVPALLELNTCNERIKYLLDTQTVEHYFNVLQQEARAIGQDIKHHIKKKLSNGIIGVYNIHLPHTWFYEGFLAGLSSPEEPILLATFNNDFYSHAQALRTQHIYALHMPVVLLSKIKKKQDVSYIKNLWKAHDGVWFNRISRLEESRNPKDWGWDWGVETTPLDTKTFINIVRETISELQKSKSVKK